MAQKFSSWEDLEITDPSSIMDLGERGWIDLAQDKVGRWAPMNMVMC
jgi:hypothetical protein